MTEEFQKVKVSALGLMPGATPNPGEKFQILVVDDSEMDFALLYHQIKMHGGGLFELTHAPNNETALQLIMDKQFSAVLVDFDMVYTTGADFAIRAKANNFMEPCIVWTGFDFDSPQLKEILEHPQVWYLNKGSAPIKTVQVLRAAIDWSFREKERIANSTLLEQRSGSELATAVAQTPRTKSDV